jgi:hypothetical protein
MSIVPLKEKVWKRKNKNRFKRITTSGKRGKNLRQRDSIYGRINFGE